MSSFDVLFSSTYLTSVIRMMTPIVFVAMAACVGRKANIMCIAYEGMMLFAALGGALGSAMTQSLGLGALIGLASGMLIALIFAYFALYLDTSAMLAGLALNTLGSCGTIYLLYMILGRKSDSASVPGLSFPTVNIPVIEDIPVLGAVLSGHNLLSYVAVLAVILVYIFIYKTPAGLRIRSVGENPSAAVSLGIDVKKTKFTAMMISGFLASMGGLFMSMAYIPYFTKDMTAGRGFMGIAACNLAGGHPIGAFLCALVFGAADALGNVAQTFRLPSQFANMIPYAVTIVGLCFIGDGDRDFRQIFKGRKKKNAKV